MIEFTGNIQVHHPDQTHKPKPCPDNCPCKADDALTTPLDLEDTE